MRVTFHGVRGSTPCQSDDIRRYGGNTSCVSIDAPGQNPLLLDMGTGLRYYGKQVPADTLFRGNCLLTHLHWDHVQGLPFFARCFAKDPVSTCTGRPGRRPHARRGRVVHHSSSVVPRQRRRASRRRHVPRHSRRQVLDRLVQRHLATRSAPRPDVGVPRELNGHSIAYLPTTSSRSTELLRSPGALELVEGVDLLIHDAQYTKPEFAMKSTWGHCTIDYAVWLAAEAGVRRLRCSTTTRPVATTTSMPC